MSFFFLFRFLHDGRDVHCLQKRRFTTSLSSQKAYTPSVIPPVRVISLSAAQVVIKNANNYVS